jgi:anti-sigma B factor antagonist
MLFGTVDAERHMMNTADHPTGTGAAPAQSDSTFKIQYQLRDRGVAIIQVAGRTDSNAVHKISQTIKDMFHKDHYRLIFDCAGMTYITSGGIGAIASAITEAQANGGDIVLINPSPPVKHIIVLLGLNELIPIANSIKDALNNFNWWPHEKE